MKLYCKTCGKLACLMCAIRGGKHHDHDYCELKQAFKQYKEEISFSVQPMERQQATIKEVLAQLDTLCEEIAYQRATTQDSIHVTFRRQHEVLAARETELIGKLDRITQEKLKGLAVQKDQPRDHPGSTQQLSPLHGGEYEDRQRERFTLDEDKHGQASERTHHSIPTRHVEAQHRS